VLTLELIEPVVEEAVGLVGCSKLGDIGRPAAMS